MTERLEITREVFDFLQEDSRYVLESRTQYFLLGRTVTEADEEAPASDSARDVPFTGKPPNNGLVSRYRSGSSHNRGPTVHHKRLPSDWISRPLDCYILAHKENLTRDQRKVFSTAIDLIEEAEEQKLRSSVLTTSVFRELNEEIPYSTVCNWLSDFVVKGLLEKTPKEEKDGLPRS